MRLKSMTTMTAIITINFLYHGCSPGRSSHLCPLSRLLHRVPSFSRTLLRLLVFTQTARLATIERNRASISRFVPASPILMTTLCAGTVAYASILVSITKMSSNVQLLIFPHLSHNSSSINGRGEEMHQEEQLCRTRLPL